jgi:hypothetical protein
MPRKPRRNRGMRWPGLHAPKEKKQAFIDWKNRELEETGSKWRYGFSSADPNCVCLLAAEKPKHGDFEGHKKKNPHE